VTNYYLTRIPMPSPTPIAQEVPLLIPATPRATLPPVADTKTYISETPAFKFEYPRNWNILKCDSAVVLYQSESVDCEDLSNASFLLQFSSSIPLAYEGDMEGLDELEMSIDNVDAVLTKYEENETYAETLEFKNTGYNYLFTMWGRDNQSAFGNLLTSFEFLDGE